MSMNRDDGNGDLTVGRLARLAGLSRATLLYYDRIRILRPTGRSGANYRQYSRADRDRLEQICFYRRMGIPLADIGRLLDNSGNAGTSGQILQRRLAGLETQIEALQQQQQQIVRLLDQLSSSTRARGSKRAASARARRSGKATPVSLDEEMTMVSKQRWVEIMKAAGFGEDEMRNWHKSFERMEPQGHQEFLESLSIGREEIARIREWSAK